MTPEAVKNQKNADTPFIKKVICKELVEVQTVLEEKAVYLKKETTTARYLKIQPYYKQHRLASGNPQRIMPELKLCGNWLADAGFEADSYVSVTVMDGLLVIRAAKVEEA